GAGELAGVDVDHGHRLGAVDDQGAAGGQVDLAVHRLQQLLVDAVLGEHVLLADVPGDPLEQVRGDLGDIGMDVVVDLAALDDQRGEVLVEDVADHLDGDVRLLGEGHRRGAALLRLGDLLPLGAQALDVVGELLFARPLGGGAHDDARVLGDDLAHDLLQPRPLGVGQLAGDAGHGAAGHEHHVAAGQGDLAGQARALVPDRVLGDLDEHRVAALERELDAARLALEAHGVPVDLAGVEHRVAAPADVHEGRLHRRQHVLDLAHVDVADHRGLRLLGDVVLDEHIVLEHGDLGAAGALAHHPGALDGLAARQELRLGDHVAAAARIAPLAAALPLGLQAGRPLDGLDLVPRLADLDHGVRRIVRGAGVVVAAAGAAPTPTPTRAGGAGGGVAAGIGAVPAGAGLGIVLRGLAVRLVVAVGAV